MDDVENADDFMEFEPKNLDDLPRPNAGKLADEAFQFLLRAKRAVAESKLPKFFLGIQELRASLKLFQKAAGKARPPYIIGDSLLAMPNKSLTSLSVENVQTRLADLIKKFRDAAAKNVALAEQFEEVFCDELDKIYMFEKLPRSCIKPFQSRTRDVGIWMTNSIREATQLLTRTLATEEKSDEADIQNKVNLMELLSERPDLNHVLKFVSPEARFYYNLFVLEVKAAVAACHCKNTRMDRIEKNNTAIGMVKGMMGSIHECDKVGVAKGGSAKKPAAKKPAAKKPPAKKSPAKKPAAKKLVAKNSVKK